MNVETEMTRRWAGQWQIGGPLGICLSLERRPRWLHRQMMRLLLGIEWVDV